MKRCYLFFIWLISALLLVLATARAGTTDLPLSVRQMSMGFTVSNRQAEPLLIFTNPSMLCKTRRWTLSSFYSRPYGLKEIDLAAAAFTCRLGNWTTTLAGASCGFELFREQQLTIGIGAPLF